MSCSTFFGLKVNAVQLLVGGGDIARFLFHGIIFRRMLVIRSVEDHFVADERIVVEVKTHVVSFSIDEFDHFMSGGFIDPFVGHFLSAGFHDRLRGCGG